MNIDDVKFFDYLAAEMNDHPDRFRLYGEAYMDAVIVMSRPDGDFNVRLTFDELRCDGVNEISSEELALCDYRLEGPLVAWQTMFDDISDNGRATGLNTINSMVMLSDEVTLRGADPMGLDRFSRFNQTLQEFLDGAAHLTRTLSGN
jgi:hypothetical protein